LAYYLQLISTDDQLLAPLQRIQAMVAQANRILTTACAFDSTALIA
jgi:hypothetical protein